jgi:hypothetical protein
VFLLRAGVLMSRSLVVALLLVSVAVPLSAQTISITTCGQTVPTGATGVVANDIACAFDAPFVVTVARRGRLDLAGFTLSGGTTGVHCDQRCTVVSTGGVGTIRDAAVGLSLAGTRTAAVLENLSFESNDVVGLLADMQSSRIMGGEVNLSGNPLGMRAGRVRLYSVTASGNHTVFEVRHLRLDLSTIANNTGYGVSALLAQLRQSTVFGSGAGADLFTQRRPRLLNSSCGVSRVVQSPTETWGICVND